MGGAQRPLAVELSNGLQHLPFSTKQIARAKALTKDLRAHLHAFSAQTHETSAIAAAIAYAIVFVNQVPLSAAEVAAPFRISATRLRAAFELLRAELDLTRADVRYKS
jgi:hypothetical protein